MNSVKEMGSVKQETFPVTGMSCAACALGIEGTISNMPGVKNATVNFASETLQVVYESGQIGPEAMKAALQQMGYDILVNTDTAVEDAEAFREASSRKLRRNTMGALVLSVPLVIVGMFFMGMPYANWIMLVLATPVVFGFGRQFFINAWKQASHGSANMDTLVALSTGVAYGFSLFNTVFPHFFHRQGLHAHVYYEAAGVVIAFILLGKWLEERAKGRTSTAIKKLMGLQPKTVRLMRDGQPFEVPIETVVYGDEILLRPGDQVAVDGKVVSGASYVDESMISGEPIPVEKYVGEEVLAGTINQQGSLVYKAEKVGKDTLLASIIRLVQEAQGSKAPVQRLVDRVAAIFVPAVLGISVLTFCVWWFAGGENALAHALITSISVLVIACPCALGLATPTAIMVGVGKGAENGMLIKSAEALEGAAQVDTVVLDKTGTVTYGRPEVKEIAWLNGGEEFAGVLLKLELLSEHPLAGAITKYLELNEILPVEVKDFKSFAGQGVEGRSGEMAFWVGSPRWVGEKIDSDSEGILKDWQERGWTVVLFGEGHKILAVIGIADPVKETSKAAVSELLRMGIDVHLFTGDNWKTAAQVALEAGISNVRAEMMPIDKAAGVQALQAAGRKVAMVGDGINDTQSLAVADIGIAMGKGSDIALDAAKIVLIHSDLSRLPAVIRLSKKTVAVIRQNLFWAFIYNIIGIPLAAGVLYPITGFLLNPMIAGAAMALSSVSVVSNSLRLKLNWN